MLKEFKKKQKASLFFLIVHALSFESCEGSKLPPAFMFDPVVPWFA